MFCEPTLTVSELTDNDSCTMFLPLSSVRYCQSEICCVQIYRAENVRFIYFIFTSFLFLTGSAKLIEKATYSGIILPSADWHTLSHHGLIAKITYRIRVQCDKNYFSPTCMKLCRPRDDKFGHFTCDPNGNKECIAGWKGTNCEIGKSSTWTFSP